VVSAIDLAGETLRCRLHFVATPPFLLECAAIHDDATTKWPAEPTVFAGTCFASQELDMLEIVLRICLIGYLKTGPIGPKLLIFHTSKYYILLILLGT